MIKELLTEKLNKKDFQERIDELHAYDIANELKELTPLEQETLYQLLTDEQIAEIVAYLDPAFAADL